MIKKLKTIIFSRFKKTKTESFIEERRKICNACNFNTKNIEKLDLKTKIVKFFSDLYSTVTGKHKVDNLGNCTACSICSIYFKTAEKVEQCPDKPSRWNKIKD